MWSPAPPLYPHHLAIIRSIYLCVCVRVYALYNQSHNPGHPHSSRPTHFTGTFFHQQALHKMDEELLGALTTFFSLSLSLRRHCTCTLALNTARLLPLPL